MTPPHDESRVGFKRRARVSVPSSPGDNAALPTTIAASSPAQLIGTNTDAMLGDRPRRASRVFSQIRDGFKRSESTTSAAGRTSRSGKELALPVRNMDSAVSGLDVPSSSHTTQNQNHIQRGDKRRRIGEYAGPNTSENAASDPEIGSSAPIQDTSVTLAPPVETRAAEVAQQTIQQGASTATTQGPETSATPSYTPPVVPLTDSDPFLDDRLRSLEAIRSVLGDEVVRRLPSVESLRRLSHAQAPSNEQMDRQVVDDEAGRARPISLPPSTLELLNELDSATLPSTANDPSASSEQPAPPISATQTPIHQTAASTVLSNDHPSTPRGERNARRASIRNLTNRIGGWLGVGSARNEQSDEAVAASTVGAGDQGDMSIDASTTPVNATTPSPPDVINASSSDTNAATRAPATATPGTRLATGAVMIVQGFVQTTVPARERRTRGDRNAGSAPEGASTSTLPRRASHSGTTAANASAPSPLHRESLFEPHPLRNHPPSSHSWIAQERAAARGRDAIRGAISPSEEEVAATTAAMDTINAAAFARAASASGSGSSSTLPRNTSQLDTSPAATVSAPASQESLSARPVSTRRNSAKPDSRRPGELPRTAEHSRAHMITTRSSPSVTSSSTSTSVPLPPPPNAHAGGSNTVASQAGESSAPATPRPEPPSFVQQARMLGGLLSEAPAGQVPDRGVEDVLREYMSHAMASSRTPSSNEGNQDQAASTMPSLSTILPTTDPASFEAFLNNMQTALIQSLREFVEGLEDDQEREDLHDSDSLNDSVHTPHQHASTGSATSGSASTLRPVHQHVVTASTAHTASRPAPRELNFFRMFQFPARPNPPDQGSDPTAPAGELIPAVIVGVRSMNRDINSLTTENVAATPFPFNDTDNIQGGPNQGVAAAAADSPSAQNVAAEAQPTTDLPELAAPNQERTGSWSARALRSFNRLRRQRAAARNESEGSNAGDTHTRNYVLWVVGGNYPVGHPILTLPHLFTGELSHDDLWVLAEALGQVKPPVASRSDIQNSGLVIITGNQVKDEAASGAILANCVEQCLICLAEYEEEEVRIMACKHAFHKECIDHWLEVGRNSCPACRQAGVKTASERTSQSATASSAATPPVEDVNMS
ncbi:hypothetical protein QFC19_000618 [Naganishia cerealis]|uniref:Uncharacterized protein n=1 Tax=Naganishia cerealis TaxID=610337 RepID=A0ACC2WLI3_9TREE|nr:hypothetical protein QFC19_000618 [Naganishia cerealis]